MTSVSDMKTSEESLFVEKVIQISRVNKVVKGGKRLAFRSLVIVGDTKGHVGVGLGKSKEVPIAIKKAIEKAKKSMISVHLVGGTIPHQVTGVFGAARVFLKPAPPGTGVIAGGAVRILLEALGLRNIVAKSLGSDSSINTARAALNGLLQLRNLEEEIKLRGKTFNVRFFKDEEGSDALFKVPTYVKQEQKQPRRPRPKDAPRNQVAEADSAKGIS